MSEKNQENLLSRLFESQPQPAFWMTPVYNEDQDKIVDFEYGYCNEEMYKYIGINATLIGKRLLSSPALNSDELRKKYFAEFLEVFETGCKIKGTLFNTLFNKYYSFLRSRVENGVLTILHDRDNEYHLISELRKQKAQLEKEKTEQKKALLEIAKQKSLLDSILKSSPSGISVTEAVRDEAGNICDWKTIELNEASTKLSGFTKEEMLQKTIGNLVPDFWESELSKAGLSTLQTGVPFHTQYYNPILQKWLDISVAKMDDNHLINIYSDITETKTAQIQLEKSVEALNRSNASLEEFAYAASHDLKEPIRKVRTFSERLKEKLQARMTEQELNMFLRMEKASERMELLVEDLLAYSHVSEQPKQLEEVNLNNKIQRVLEDLEMMIAEKGAKIIVAPLPTIKGFKGQIQQLFQNLISNALKYSKPDTPPEIHINSTTLAGKDIPLNIPDKDKSGSFYVIRVIDNGIGFEQQYAERVFQMFQRLHGKNEYSGTGVGLSIAKKVVENHRGYIKAESEPGKGSTFSFYLPA